MCYHIGNGKSVNILNHPWLPGLNNIQNHINQGPKNCIQGMMMTL